MVDLSRIGKNLGAENIAGAMSAADQAKEEEEEKKRKIKAGKGLGLHDIPKTPAPTIEQQETMEAITDDSADTILDKVDYELSDLQDLLKNVLAKKIKLADKHEDRKHELLISAFNDCKSAYTKIRQVREEIS